MTLIGVYPAPVGGGGGGDEGGDGMTGGGAVAGMKKGASGRSNVGVG